MSCGTAARLGLARSPRSPQQNSQLFVNFSRNKRRRHQPQPQHNNSRRTAAAAASAAAASAAAAAASSSSSSAAAALAAAVARRRPCGVWRWRCRLRRRRCGTIATVVDKISTKYNITQQQKTRSHGRERGSAGSLAPTPEVARTRHASSATLWCLRIKVGLCLLLPSTAHSEQCLLCAAVWVVPSCPLIVVPLCLESNGGKLGICRPIV